MVCIRRLDGSLQYETTQKITNIKRTHSSCRRRCILCGFIAIGAVYRFDIASRSSIYYRDSIVPAAGGGASYRDRRIIWRFLTIISFDDRLYIASEILSAAAGPTPAAGTSFVLDRGPAGAVQLRRETASGDRSIGASVDRSPSSGRLSGTAGPAADGESKTVGPSVCLSDEPPDGSVPSASGASNCHRFGRFVCTRDVDLSRRSFLRECIKYLSADTRPSIDLCPVGRSVDRSVGRMVGRRIGRSVDAVGQSIDMSR